MNRYLFIIIPLLGLISSCAELKLDPPYPAFKTALVLPVFVDNKSQEGQHGFYYVYKIEKEQGYPPPYEAIIKTPIKGDMLIVDSLAAGNYTVSEFKFLTVGSGNFTYGDNVEQRNDRFKLEYGKITIFQQALNVRLFHQTPGRGMETTYDFQMDPITPDQREKIINTLSELDNFTSWELQQ